LLAQREPVYAQADITVQSRDVAHDNIVADIVAAVASFLPPGGTPAGQAGPKEASRGQASPGEATERKVGQ
jgi:shikimate kinase